MPRGPLSLVAAAALALAVPAAVQFFQIGQPSILIGAAPVTAFATWIAVLLALLGALAWLVCRVPRAWPRVGRVAATGVLAGASVPLLVLAMPVPYLAGVLACMAVCAHWPWVESVMQLLGTLGLSVAGLYVPLVGPLFVVAVAIREARRPRPAG